MERIDTHDVEVAFDELMKELSKLKDLNTLVDVYKDNIDVLSSKVHDLTEQIETFYNSAKAHEAQVNTLYNSFVDEAESISAELEKRNLEYKKIGKRNTIFNVITLILSISACIGLAYLIFFV